MAWITVKGSALSKGLEPTFEEALRGLAGSWTIEVHDGLVGGWWPARVVVHPQTLPGVTRDRRATPRR